MANYRWHLAPVFDPCEFDLIGVGGAGGVRALHQLLLGTVGAQDVGSVGDEAASHQAGLAAGTDEAIVMPVTILKRNEASAANA